MSEAAKKTETTEPRVVVGRVVSNKMQKTITVMVERQVTHPLYGKQLRRSSKLHAHDAEGKSGPGDLVSIRECRRLSATKNWELVEVLQKANAVEAQAVESAAGTPGA